MDAADRVRAGHRPSWTTLIAIVLALAAPAAAIVICALFPAPRASRRLPLGRRIPLELGVFLVAAVATTGDLVLTVVFLVVVVANALVLTAFRQWEA